MYDIPEIVEGVDWVIVAVGVVVVPPVPVAVVPVEVLPVFPVERVVNDAILP